jgi:hypothetical protein
MNTIKNVAEDGILFNLGFEIPQATVSVIPLTTLQQRPLVMLSYSHVDNKFCDGILELLDVWIDKRCCKSSTDVWETIAKGITNAQLIICIVSSGYLASKACRQEIIYAKDRLNKCFFTYISRETRY